MNFSRRIPRPVDGELHLILVEHLLCKTPGNIDSALPPFFVRRLLNTKRKRVCLSKSSDALLQEAHLAPTHHPKMPHFNRNSSIYRRKNNCNTKTAMNILFRYVLAFLKTPKNLSTDTKTYSALFAM